MRRFIFDQDGEAAYYLTGAGVLYNVANQAVGWLQEDGLVSPEGEIVGWFDGQFLRDAEGYLVGFVKGAKEAGLELPRTKPLAFTPAPVPTPFYPLLVTRDKPSFKQAWSEKTLAQAPVTYLT